MAKQGETVGPSRWTNEINIEVRDLWAIGTSALEISKIIAVNHKFELSRSAIIGRCHRMGWRSPKRGQVAPRRPRQSKARRTYQQTGSDGPLLNRLRAFTPPKVSLEPRPLSDQYPVGGRNMKLIDLGPHDCRYATSPDDAESHLFCGLATVEGSSYCATHHALCWRTANRNSKLGVQSRSSPSPLTGGTDDAGTGGCPVPPPTNLPHNKTRSEHAGSSS
jgi:hypothetical protein